jgi:hypothetical protein
MTAITVNGDGNYIFLALEDASGFQVITRTVRDQLFESSEAYAPGAGSAGNVEIITSNPDAIFMHGNFNTDVLILTHTISTETNADLSPGTLGAKVCNTLIVNPSGVGEAWATINTDQDLLRTTDAGVTWPAIDAALGFDATALDTLWSGGFALDRAFIAGKPLSVELQYTPNEGASKDDQANAGLAAVANICSIIAIPA